MLCDDRTLRSPGGGRTTVFHKYSLAGFSHQKLVVWLAISSKFLSPAEKAFQDTRCTITILTGAKQTVSNFLEQRASYQSQTSTHSQNIFSLKVSDEQTPCTTVDSLENFPSSSSFSMEGGQNGSGLLNGRNSIYFSHTRSLYLISHALPGSDMGRLFIYLVEKLFSICNSVANKT